MITNLVLLWQVALPTVGDTVWIERVVNEVGRTILRPQQWDLGAEGAQLGPPVVAHGAAGISIRYPVVLWFPGERVLTMPGPVLVYPDGTSDTLPASVHRVRLQSVLPPDQAKSRIPPRPPTNPLALEGRTIVPLVVLLAGALMLIGLALFLWRRRGKPEPGREAVFREPDAELLRRWTALGEYRAALHHWGWRLNRRMKQSQDLKEIAELQRILEEIGDRTFVREHPERLAVLAGRASELDRE